ncbi:MAG: NAD(P)H-hydrate dehydratase [Sphingomonadales bacterium]|nr:NAD(P)H-hydrate dehydratase [Sphingomonadales bacterium]
MYPATDLVLTAAQMRSAEAALIARGTAVEALMQRAGRGAAEWVWRIGGGRGVTVVAGPGNNGGDGWVIAEAIRQRGGDVAVVVAAEPGTPAAQAARAGYGGAVLGMDATRHAEVMVDCLFGTGLTRPMRPDHAALLSRLANSHARRVAIDLPSGIESDLGQPLNPGLPAYHLTVALGAWKRAHFLMPGTVHMGTLVQVGIGIDHDAGTGRAIGQPRLAPPKADAHKYTRGLLGVVGGAMPGAAYLAASAAQHAGAGYVKLFGAATAHSTPDLVHDASPLADALNDRRLSALLIGPGLGRDAAARAGLAAVLGSGCPVVLDADALVLLGPEMLDARAGPIIATPHDGELFSLERAFGLEGAGSKVDRAAALARASGMIVVAKGPDSIVAAPDGRVAYAARASAWLSTAGTGDVLAGIVASRLASGEAPFDAACQALWLHAAAARRAGAAFTASQLAAAVQSAYAACL